MNDPERFSDKLGWYKLYYRDELMRNCTDKALVRDYVKSCGLGHLLNELYGFFDNVENIDWNKLPKQFVLKSTLGGSSNGILLVFDKDTLDKNKTRSELRSWIKKDSYRTTNAAEWVYEERKARIIVEKLLIPVSRTDYKRITEQPEKPKNCEQMIRTAEILSASFPHVRVDLYNIDGNIVF